MEDREKRYYDAQFARLGAETPYGYDLKITSGSGGTNWMRISARQLEAIKAILKEES